MVVEFSLKLVYAALCWKKFQIYDVYIPRKCIESRSFYSCSSSPHSKLSLSCYYHTLGRGKLLISPGNCFSRSSFPQQQKSVEQTMIWLIRIQSENMKMTWNIRLFIFCMICNFFKCDGSTVLKIISII